MVAESKAIKVLVDDSQLLAAIGELSLFKKRSDLPPSVVDRLVSFINFPPKIAKLESAMTEGTCLTVILKPSDCFSDLLAAVRAIDLERRVVGNNRGHKFLRLRALSPSRI